MSSVEDRLDSDYFVSEISGVQDTTPDPDYGNKTILKDVSKNLKETIDALGMISSVKLGKDQPLTVEQQIAVNQNIINILTPIKQYIDSKIQQISEEV